MQVILTAVYNDHLNILYISIRNFFFINIFQLFLVIYYNYISLQIFYKKNNERNAIKIEKMEQDGPISKRLKGKNRAKPKPIHKEPGTKMYLMHKI